LRRLKIENILKCETMKKYTKNICVIENVKVLIKGVENNTKCYGVTMCLATCSGEPGFKS
jgi:hypothetical protein